MAKNYGTGVSRVLDPAQAQLLNVIFQQGKPPMDAEFNLFQDLAQASRQAMVTQGMPSGWIGNGVNDPEAYLTNPAWSNWFRFGQQATGETRAIQWAAINGWLIPVTGTQTGTPPGSPDDVSTWNRVTLSPPPSNSGDTRIDFVFLEAWQALVPPNPASTNKPAVNALYRYGNVEGGQSFLADDLIDPALGFETSQRVQIQYRIRVVTGLVGLQSFPDGFDPANVKGRGTATADTSFTFANMRQALGDPGLWRAGDGTANSLGTVDGYTYAIPLCAVFRRNSVAWDGDPGQNLNGGFNRNPTAIDRTGWTTFTAVPTVATAMTSAQLTLTLSTATAIGLPASPATPVTIQVGDEIMTYSTITGTTMTLTARGQLGTRAEVHAVGEQVLAHPGRPDGLFSDQVAKTDVLDLRHVVNPNGFDHSALLDGAIDQVMRGRLRANWKRSGGGPQGTFVTYQDKVSASAAALGVTKLDAPDGLRQIWSDASVLQPFEAIFQVPSGAGTDNIVTTWGLDVSATSSSATSEFFENDVLTIPISQFQTATGVTDQVQFPSISALAQPVVRVRIVGSETDLTVGTDFTVNTPTGPSNDLQITLGAAFNPAVTSSIHVTFHVQYGAGRGMSRRPDMVHSLAYLNAASGTVLRQKGIPANNIPVSVGWAPLWSKFRSGTLSGRVPVTAESYIDPGSKTVVLSPFRQVNLPNDAESLVVIQNATLHGGEGVMPNPASKWGTTTDPLELFSTGADPTIPQRDTFAILPRGLMPGWGEVHAPIIHTDSGTLVEGINFGFNAPKGSLGGSNLSNFIPFDDGDRSFATFTTVELPLYPGTVVPATFNERATATTQGTRPAGMRFFTDSRGLGRVGLELPPFYGIARLFGVYEAEDFATSGSPYNSSTRVAGSGATNLLKQDFEGPTFWIEIDSDGDSTFILNSECIDTTRSPNTIASFEAGHYVIDASVFGFDRGAFDLSSDCRIVLARTRPNDTGGIDTTGVNLVIPAPPQAADSIAVNYSRTPYQGDAWGSQGNQQDIGQTLGPRTSADANQVGFTELTEDSLTRPNQKVFEVLASKAFMSTLGTGRVAGDYDSTAPLDWRNPGYEDTAAYPPTSAVAARPTYDALDALGTGDGLITLGTEYHGLTTRLPLGALYRDKDFRGEAIEIASGSDQSPVGLVFRDPGPGQAGSLARTSNLEQRMVPVYTSSQGGGGAGEILVHVDGETGNLSLLTNFRTTRGGSAFVASGPYPGGELSSLLSRLPTDTNYNSVLCGVAYLVRNTVTSIGSTEVSAGSELMLLVATTAVRRHGSNEVGAFLFLGTNGSGEGFSAADVFRISGRPLTNNGVRLSINPSTIPLNGKVSLKPRIGG